MSDLKQITPEEHQQQIQAYAAERPVYCTYATVLKHLLTKACAAAIPEAFVQARAKTLSSFAEKCARRYERYPDAVRQMTDLCGARVIVQTLEQVLAVREFIEANFDILERDDKGLHLSEDKFGYRDLHYIIRLHPEHCAALGISPDEAATISTRRAEIQVRTWLQHAWADSLHDRIYKNSLPLSPDIRRTGALLAALMEESDRNFDVMIHQLDDMFANYTAFASRTDVRNEIALQQLMLQNEPNPGNKPGLALKLARLLAACGEYQEVIKVLEPHQQLDDANRCERLQKLGYALCKVHRHSYQSESYQKGLSLLKESLSLCACSATPFVPNLSKRESLYARAYAWLGWALENIQDFVHDARRYKQQAHEHEPTNPYYLADMLGFEIYCSRQAALPATMRTVITEAIATCHSHATSGIELPYAYFTTGRLYLLLNQPLEALGYYARGIQHYLNAELSFPADSLDEEISWITRLHFGEAPPEQYQWTKQLLALALRVKQAEMGSASVNKVLIITGGATSIDNQTLKCVEPLLKVALQAFTGKVISGGTTVGVPGLVGSITSLLKEQNEKHFDLIGYLPERLPPDSPRDPGYDHLLVSGRDNFSPTQLLQSWEDLLQEGVMPTNVLLLGFGGGTLSALEYRMALAFGASVAVVNGTGGATDALLKDKLWSNHPNLMPLPLDESSIRAFVAPPLRIFEESVLTEMAKVFHENFVANSTGRMPDNMKPWPKLPETFKRANTEQARYAVQILEACGFGVRETASPIIFENFTIEEVEFMAKMEHGRWNIERLRDGWRYGPRNDALKLHNCLVSWDALPEDMRKYDRDAALSFPSILAKAGLEVYRK